MMKLVSYGLHQVPPKGDPHEGAAGIPGCLLTEGWPPAVCGDNSKRIAGPPQAPNNTVLFQVFCVLLIALAVASAQLLLSPGVATVGAYGVQTPFSVSSVARSQIHGRGALLTSGLIYG